jgi:hypothetical protein
MFFYVFIILIIGLNNALQVAQLRFLRPTQLMGKVTATIFAEEHVRVSDDEVTVTFPPFLNRPHVKRLLIVFFYIKKILTFFKLYSDLYLTRA